jgi:hypothetical protein
LTKQSHHILNPVFLISLIILILNDHILKEQYPNWLTGKLSDFFGVIVFVQFLSVFVAENSRKVLYLIVALAFIYWKSEWSSSFIDFWNFTFPYFRIQRVVDYTDLICLICLIPLFHYKPKQFQFSLPKQLIFYPILAVTFFAILATSRPKYFGNNEVYINELVKLKMNKNEFLNQLTKDNVKFSKDSIIIAKETFDKYVLNNIVINQDTIYSATIGIHDENRRIKVYVEKITLSKDWNNLFFQNYKDFEKWKKKYKVETISYFEKLDE